MQQQQSEETQVRGSPYAGWEEEKAESSARDLCSWGQICHRYQQELLSSLPSALLSITLLSSLFSSSLSFRPTHPVSSRSLARSLNARLLCEIIR